MKPFTVLLTLLLLCLAANLTLAGAPAADLYKAKCAMCHGADGSDAARQASSGRIANGFMKNSFFCIFSLGLWCPGTWNCLDAR